MACKIHLGIHVICSSIHVLQIIADLNQNPDGVLRSFHSGRFQEAQASSDSVLLDDSQGFSDSWAL